MHRRHALLLGCILCVAVLALLAASHKASRERRAEEPAGTLSTTARSDGINRIEVLHRTPNSMSLQVFAHGDGGAFTFNAPGLRRLYVKLLHDEHRPIKVCQCIWVYTYLAEDKSRQIGNYYPTELGDPDGGFTAEFRFPVDRATTFSFNWVVRPK
ncbi:MAG: hypothetical protein A3K19_30050 [Lentisphaerae bacterium RIFOXYB12_FULL_65_16]|nr:MAG: hypothetical protein A3K18_33660 [Lentisphaerae bacterium RIFOXYA12_64_32]OGV86568.1 MAG: hypothetical protein A3K19_30050 [Lentisphaerae bacterium RIFOXYB12_FULL_65_16]